MAPFTACAKEAGSSEQGRAFQGSRGKAQAGKSLENARAVGPDRADFDAFQHR